MLKLKNPYISVAYESGNSFGGSQRLSGNNTLCHCGCGVIAAVDLILYMCKHHECCAIDELKEYTACDTISKPLYNKLVLKMSRSYFPVIPKFGMNGLGLMAGMQLFFKRYSLPYRCHWCVSDKGIWEKVEYLLNEDIPVIMSVGPNFPRIWKNGRVNLYTKNENGEYKAVSSIKAHFITVTGIDEQWLEISSWGKRYYINRRMYEEYVSNYSAALVSNILYVKKAED